MKKTQRSGCKDIWNAFMCSRAVFSPNDIPVCPSSAIEAPKALILWDEAISIYNKNRRRGNLDFTYDAFVCFYLDDYKFDGPKGIWQNYKHALEVLRHFAGAITPDFSTYQDFPEPIKIYNTFRMRAFGYWLSMNNIKVINNVRWGTRETWKYCWDGIPINSIVAIGTVGGNPSRRIDRTRFNEGFEEMLRVLKPHTIVVYGSANYPVFEKAKSQGIRIISFASRTATAFERRKHLE